MTSQFKSFAFKWIASLSLATLLTACGGGAGTESEGNNKPLPPSSSSHISSANNVVSSSESSSQLHTSSSELSSLANLISSKSSEAYSRAARESSSSSHQSSELLEIDLPPTRPATPGIALISYRNIGLYWGSAHDDTGVTGYEILRNGTHIASTDAATLAFDDRGLTQDTTYSYAIRAVDIIGNRSLLTMTINAKTLAEVESSSSQTSSTSSTYSSSNLDSLSSAVSSTSLSISSKSLSSSKPNSISSSSRASSSIPSRTINLAWDIPKQREDGSFLELNEISGYELRHKPKGSVIFISRVISNATTRNFSLTGSRSDIFEIAAFDRNGLYSKFVKITPP